VEKTLVLQKKNIGLFEIRMDFRFRGKDDGLDCGFFATD
jgi:hypothetical protein